MVQIFFPRLFEKFKVSEKEFAKLLQNSAEVNGIPQHGIFANSVHHTEGTEVKKGTEFRVDGIP
jgi:hypothetical protein